MLRENQELIIMFFEPYMELYPNYEEGIFDDYDGTRKVPTHSYLKDGDILYLVGSTVLCKYDISDIRQPKLLLKQDICADHTGDPAKDYIRRQTAHSTAIVDLGDHLVIGLRGGGGGVENMADGVTVGNISIVEKSTLKKVKEINFENRITYITKYKDFLIVSLHFHGFYIYRLSHDADFFTCVNKYILCEKPRTASAREFQNSMVIETGPEKINIAFAAYIYGIRVFTYDMENNVLSSCSELNPWVFPNMRDDKTGAKNYVFGITTRDDFVYGGISPGNKRFSEKYKDVDWNRLDRRGILYGRHDKLAEEYYHMELPDADKPGYIGVIAGDPGPSFLCTAGDYLLFNLDKQGLGIAKIEKDNTLTYIGRTLEDPDGRMLTYRMHFDGEILYTSYKMPIPEQGKPPVFRMYKVKFA